MLKQNIYPKIVVVYEYLKFPYEGFHSPEGRKHRLRQVSGG